MNKKTKKFLCFLLTILLVLSVFTFTASAAIENTYDDNTVLLDHFNSSNQATAEYGEINYVNSVEGLDKAADLTNGGRLKYDLPGWYQWGSSYDPSGKEGTIEFWIFPKKYGGILNLNWNDSTSPPSAGYILDFGIDPGGIVGAGIWTAITAPELTPLPLGNKVVPLNQWSHIAFTWGSAGTKVFVNGELDASTPDNIYPALNSMVYLYVNNWSGNDIGFIDELTISKVQKTYTPIPTPTPIPDEKIIPVLSTDMEKYIQGDNVPVTLKLKDVLLGKTNSVTFELDFDADTFEPLNNDAYAAVKNGYIPFDTKLIVGQGSNKRLVITYLDMNGDITLQEGGKVFTANFKIKDNPAPGVKSFTLNQVTMLNSDGNVYNINNDLPVIKQVEVINAAVIEGSINLYMGEGTGLNNQLIPNLNQVKVNETLANLKFTLKHNSNDAGVFFSGNDVFLHDENGNLGSVDLNGRLSGKFRLNALDCENTKMSIDGVGYLKKELTIAPNLGQVYTISNMNTPLELYPGEIGQIINRTLSLTPDGKVISNTDFSAWLTLFKKNFTSTINEYDKLRIDFSKNGEIDNEDFTLWLESYKQVLSPSNHAPNVFYNPQSFKDATRGFNSTTLIDFEDIDAGAVNGSIEGRPEFDSNYYIAKGISMKSPINRPLYISPGGLFWNINNSLSVNYFPYDSDPNNITDDSFSITLNQPCKAFGLTLIDSVTSSQTEYAEFLDANGGLITRIKLPQKDFEPFRSFLGFISKNIPIAKINISEDANDGDDVNYDDIIFCN